MISILANLFGYILNFLYNILQNYGMAIILFSILIKLLMMPLSIKQQKSMEKSAELQGKLKKINDKYKGNQEKINMETMQLYKNENVSPFSGCLSSIAQILILFAVFYLVRSPLTYMKKIDPTTIQNYTNEIMVNDEKTKKTGYPEIAIIKELGSSHDDVNINMNFLGLDLSSVPTANYKDYKVYIIPLLYVLSSIVSMKITTNMQKKLKDKNSDSKDLIVINKDKNIEEDPMEQMNKSMSLMGPLMAVSISLIAPLGLALYWLINNLLMIVERLILDKFFNKK